MNTTYRARAAVSPSPGTVEIREIDIPRPTGNEVLADVVACGLCHSDLHFIDGTSGSDHPYLLGHEVCATVREVGPAVTTLAPGDRVIVSLIRPCGNCDDCLRNRPKACRYRRPSARPPRLVDGGELTPVLRVGGLATAVLVDEHHAIPLPTGLDPQLGALLGCGATTGFGAAVNTAAVGHGDRVAVIGCGGVGLAAIAGARANGANSVIAIERDERRFDLAREFGASDTTTPASVKHTEPGGGWDAVIDCVGGATTWKLALSLVETGGRVVIAGAPRRDEEVTFLMRPLFDRRAEVVVSHLGDSDPTVDLPRIAELVAAGQFPLERYRSETVALDGAADAYQRLRRGDVLRSIVLPNLDQETA